MFHLLAQMAMFFVPSAGADGEGVTAAEKLMELNEDVINDMYRYTRLREDMCRLARFGANLTDAHSCFIFLPASAFPETEKVGKEVLILMGHHSLSNDIIDSRVIPTGYGLIGWVSKNHRSIHVSPFERDSRTLGIYREDQDLKSFIGIPVSLVHLHVEYAEKEPAGVIACDSKKAYAFSKLQGKLLENLSLEVSNVIHLHRKIVIGETASPSWESFHANAMQLIRGLGKDAVEVVRLRPGNFSAIEAQFGIEYASSLLEQMARLIRQTLPPQFPIYKSPAGDIIILLDNMMTSFFANKIDALCSHVSGSHLSGRGDKLTFMFTRASFTAKKSDSLDIEKLVSETIPGEEASKGKYYEHRRA